MEGVLSRKISSLAECENVWQEGEIPLLADETGASVKEFAPDAVIDAILAKKNLGTTKEMAPLTIALGPGFAAGYDVDFVIETMRGHDLGKIIEDGEALPNTGTPGLIAGVGKERVIHSPAEGVIVNKAKIADFVEKGQVLATVGDVPVSASLTDVYKRQVQDIKKS